MRKFISNGFITIGTFVQRFREHIIFGKFFEVFLVFSVQICVVFCSFRDYWVQKAVEQICNNYLNLCEKNSIICVELTYFRSPAKFWCYLNAYIISSYPISIVVDFLFYTIILNSFYIPMEQCHIVMTLLILWWLWRRWMISVLVIGSGVKHEVVDCSKVVQFVCLVVLLEDLYNEKISFNNKIELITKTKRSCYLNNKIIK